MAKLLLSLCIAIGPAIASPPCAASRTPADRASVLKACAALFGPSVDPQKGLFEVDRYYVLEAGFDAHGHLARLGVLPKHRFADDHPEWEEHDDVGELTVMDYDALLARLESVCSKGRLVKRATIPVVTGTTARIRDHYERAVLETDDVVDAERPDDAPRAIKCFAVYFTTN